MPDTCTRLPLRVAVRRYAIAEVEALAQLARDLGMTVIDTTPGRTAMSTPAYAVTGPGGKEALLTLTGPESPVPAVIYRNPARAASVAPRVALTAMVLPTVHVCDNPPEEAIPA